MKTSFYPKLALSNIKKNARSYIPYIITCIVTIAMYYIMKSLSLNKDLENTFGGSTLIYILELGSNVIAIFSVIFLFYTNSFLIKNRKKEFGLFNILGMEKKHIAKIIAFENIFVSFISLVFGFLFGILLDKVMYLAIAKFLKFDFALGFYVSYQAIINSLILFGILFFLIFLNSLRMIHLSKPIELLKGENTGEKEPKTKLLMAILGIICLGGGYYISLTTEDPVSALLLFFGAVILVIIGTYLTFTAGSIAILKILKKNKKYYYKTNHFISISGMIYRMKQNAVGLANICILSTMVLVMVSSTTSLIIGIEDILNTRYPYHIEMTVYDEEYKDSLISKTREILKDKNIKTKSEVIYSDLEVSAVFNNNDTFSFDTPDGTEDLDDMNQLCILFFITAEDYSNFTGENISLADDEVILHSNRVEYKNNYFNLIGKKYNIIKNTDKFVMNGHTNANIYNTYGIVVKDMSVIESICKEQEKIYQKKASHVEHIYGLDIVGDADLQVQIADMLKTEIKTLQNNNGDKVIARLECREQEREGSYQLFGSLFFLGIFLGLLFIIATVLIIYYKQISEGYDDKKRFEIMQKVGLTEKEIKSSIHSQVIIVFFLPLMIAGLHVAFAFPIIKKILMMLALNNTQLYIVCTIGSFLVFAVFYSIIYILTAKVYYKIVKK